MGRAKGTGSLVKRGNIWTAVWKVDGKVHTRSTKCTNKREAQEKLEEFTHPYQVKSEIETLENLQTQINVLESERKRTPVKDAIKLMFAVDVYRNDINCSNLSEKTIALYETLVNVLKKFTKREFMYQVTVEDATKFLEFRKQKNSIKTYNTYIGVLSQIWKVCMKHDSNIRKNPFANFKFLADTEETHRRALTDDETKSLIDAAFEDSFQFGVFFKIGAYTGLRKEDCIDLKKDECDLDVGVIRRLPIKTKKTGRKAIIPIGEELFEDLKQAIHESDNEYVLPALVNLSVTQLKTKIDDAFNKAKIKQSEKDEYGKMHHITGFHSFRHTLTKKLYRQKLPINVIMRILGHKSIKQNMVYAQAEEEDIPKIDFGRNMKDTTVKKELYAKVMSYGNGNDTFSSALEKMIAKLSQSKHDTEEFAKEEADRKIREEAELQKLIDEMFDDDGLPIKKMT